VDSVRIARGRGPAFDLVAAGLLVCWGLACSHDVGSLGAQETGGAGGRSGAAGSAAAGTDGRAGAAGGLAGAAGLAGASGPGGAAGEAAGTGGSVSGGGAGGAGASGAAGTGGSVGAGGSAGAGGAAGTGGKAGAGGLPGAGGAAGSGGGQAGSGGASGSGGSSSGSGGSGGAANCVDAIRKNGYASSGVPPCLACTDNSINRAAACQQVIDCLALAYPCSGSCEDNCQNNAGATTVVMGCVNSLVNAGCGGTSTGSGGTTGAGGSGGTGGSSGTGPCTGLCANPTAVTTQDALESNVPAGACYSTTFAIQGAECTNATAFKINGVSESCGGTALTLPAKVNGGYCFQFGSGDPSYAEFATY
jgi:hypothetical protein